MTEDIKGSMSQLDGAESALLPKLRSITISGRNSRG